MRKYPLPVSCKRKNLCLQLLPSDEQTESAFDDIAQYTNFSKTTILRLRKSFKKHQYDCYGQENGKSSENLKAQR